jgi:hypothetical protein
MADNIIIKANNSNPIKNGSMITLVFDTGVVASVDPLINQFVPTGTMKTRLENRFDPRYYTGDTDA